MNPDRARGRALIVVTAAIAFAAWTFMGGGFGGYDPGDFPIPQQDPPSQPAGWAFSIWGLIYLWLIVHSVYGLLRRDTDPGWDRTRVPLGLAVVIGISWIPVAKASPVIATVLIVLMLAGALLALIRAPRADRWWAAVPIGLFAGWLTVASGASIGIVLGGWGLAGPVVAAIVALVWAVALAAAVLGLRAEPAYAAAIVWGLVALVAANGAAQPAVSVLAGLGAVGVAALAWWRWRRASSRP